MVNQQNKSSIFIITGMHRSGTSLTASLMQNAGVHIGERLMGATPNNSKGHFENLDFVDFHEYALRSQGISQEGWTIQKNIQTPQQFFDKAKLIIAENETPNYWGWKDPRTTLFLDFWKNLLPQAYFIFAYRSPWEVIDSLYRRGDEIFSNNPQFALQIWMHYNQIISEFYQRFPEQSILLNTDNIIVDPTVISKLCNHKFGTNLKEPNQDIFDKSLMTNLASKSNRPMLIKKFFPETVELYNCLNKQADLRCPPVHLKALENKSFVRDRVFQDWLDSYKIDKNPNVTFPISESQNISFKYQPTISIIFPVYNTPEKYLIDAIESVLNQIYPHWELCIADDASTKFHIRKILDHYSQLDSRIKVVFRTENGHISRSSNTAIEIATGDFIGLLDHDDLLTSDALCEVALLLNQHPEADLIYSDEDKVNDNNQFIFPTYKPDWCPDSLLSRMYTSHFSIYRRSIVNEIGGFRVGYEGSQDYDLALRFTEKTNKIFHIPKILYHWRLHPDSTSASTTAKSYAYEAAVKSLTDALYRRGERGKVFKDMYRLGYYNIRYEIISYKIVSIIIIADNFASKLNQCLESIFTKTLYPNYEVIVLDNGTIKSSTKKIIKKWQIQEPSKFKYYSYDIGFNYSKVNNYAVTKAEGDYLVFLSSYIQVTQENWLNEIVAQVQRESIGAVGVFLFDSTNYYIQHIGLMLGSDEIANYIYKGPIKTYQSEILAQIASINNVSVVTGNCLSCRKDLFENVGGFDESLPLIYNDVDLCLKILTKGYHNIYLPYVKLIYQELINLPQELINFPVEISKKERLQFKDTATKFMQARWRKILEYDPCFTPNMIGNIKLPPKSEENIQVNFKSTQKILSPLVTICIPTYNGGKFLPEALNSVLCQTYSNIEIIISDDNSNDDTVDIANLFKQESSFKLSIFKHSRYGMSQNWNFCLSQAKGKYIKFLFQDDILEPTCIEEMVFLAEQDKEIGLVFSPRQLFSCDKDINNNASYLQNHESKDIHKAWSKLQTIQSGQQLLQNSNIFDNPINKIGEPSIVLIKKEVFDKVGLFNTELCQLVDLEMWLRIMSQYKIGFINKVLSRFRIHSQQQTRRNSELKDAISLDYQKLFHTIANDNRYPRLTRQNAVCRYAALIKDNTELRKLRKQIAVECLNLADNRLANIYSGLIGKSHNILLSNGINNQTANQEEEILFNKITINLFNNLQREKTAQNLLVGMLYYNFSQLLLTSDFSCIPKWLISDYVEFLVSFPGYFKKIWEAEKYYEYLEKCIDSFYQYIINKLNFSLTYQIIEYFTTYNNFINIYFNQRNLKSIYIKRAEILELFLKNNGCEVDYEFSDRPINRKKIRLGILATHFTPGSETFACLPVYEYLSRDFEVILYSLKQTGHPLEEHCRSCANSFKLLPQNLLEQVQTIRADDLDILFIATNVTAVTNQICLLASHRLARIQVTSGGSVVTTGMRHMDYYISGTLTDPSPAAQEHYREKLVKLEGTAHCFSYGCESEKATTEVDRENLGISEEAIVFISGANFFKIVPELIHTWAKIIVEVPNSVLVLLPFGPNWSNAYPKQAFEEHLQNIFGQYGISAKRLLVLDPQPVPNREDVKEYYKIADIYLDSYPFSGTTSLVEPLQVNLPVISRQGHTFRSAMGAAMIQSLDLRDLVANSEESYIQLAVELGTNPQLRKQKSDRIKQKMQQNPSFLDSRSYSAQMGALFQQLFQQYRVNNLVERLGLRDINLVMFPDWHQSEESLYESFANVLKTASSNSDKSRMTLLIDTDGIDGEDANWLFSSVAMNLLMEEAVDIADELEVSLLNDLSENEWELLLSLLQGRISLDNENQNAIAKAKAQSLKIYS